MSAVLVTRGDVDLTLSIDAIRDAGVDDIVVWDNSLREDLKVYGRYAAIVEAEHDVIYTQDDDAVCPVAELLAAYSDDELLVNVPPGEWPWVAWGAVFPREAPGRAFDLYPESVESDEFLLWADVVFAELTAWRAVDLGHVNLPWASAPNRMYMQPNHYVDQGRVRARVEALR